jgi:hypothetical protein
MALIISSEFGVRVGNAPDNGVSLTIGEHDIPGIEGSALMLSFEKDVAEKIYDEMGERLGRSGKGIHIATPAEARREAQGNGLDTAE